MSIVKDLFLVVILIMLFYVFRKNLSLKSKLYSQRENFIKTLSHDIRVSTLAQIRGLDLLRKDYNEVLAKEIEDSCRYSLDMINMLLNTYRYDNGEQILYMESFNLSDLILKGCKNLSESAKERNIEFRPDIACCELVWADKNEIEKCLHYLLLTLIFYAEKNSKIEISLKKANENLEVSLNYTGKPLSEEECRRMFSNNPRFSTVGHGIKMYMCKKIIEFHGGKIYVNNISDNKNNFTFTVPCVKFNPTDESVLFSKLQPFRL